MPLVNVENRIVWQALKPFLPPNTRVTSVYRSAQDQLNILVKFARELGYEFPKVPRVGRPSTWRDALKAVRKAGKKIAAPGKSAHQKAVGYDLAGPDLKAIAAGVQKAVDAGRIVLRKGVKNPLLVEKKNHCVHVEIEEVIIDTDPFEFV